MSRKNKKRDNKKANLGSGLKNYDFYENHNSLIRFNFKHYCHDKNQGQDFECWSKENLLIFLNNKLASISASNVEELIKNEVVELYGNYPKNSQFDCPVSLKDIDIVWARIRLTGRRRLIGFFVKKEGKIDNTFFMVFLDKEHEFAPYSKK